MRKSHYLIPLLLVACVLLALAGCGGSPTVSGGGARGAAASDVAKKAQQVYDKFNALKGQDRTTQLVAAAETEGSLSIYTSNTDIDKVVDGFKAKYPKIKVNVYRANSETVLQRLLQEQKAGFYGNDVFETNAGELNVAAQQGYLADYQSELRDKVREEGKRKDWTASRFNLFVIGWNTKLVKPGQEPRSLEELTDPKWNGRLAANAKVVKGHTVQGDLLAAGQFAVAVSAYSHTIDKLAADGAPVSWHPASGQPAQPLITRPNGVAMMLAAKHPAAAMLFVDFELTDSQAIFAKAHRIGSVPTANDPLAGMPTIQVPDDKLLAEGKKWDDLYTQIVQKGQQIGS